MKYLIALLMMFMVGCSEKPETTYTIKYTPELVIIYADGHEVSRTYHPVASFYDNSKKGFARENNKGYMYPKEAICE